jgi:hypothetical protein
VVSIGVFGLSDGCLDGDLLDSKAVRLQMLDPGIESTVPRYHPKGGGPSGAPR